MKVILVRDVARLGQRGTVKEVPDGHALNFLIPRKLAIIATPESMKRLNEQVTKVEEHSVEQVKVFEDALATLQSDPVKFEAVANEKGHLFKGIHAGDIATLLQKNGFQIHEGSVVLKQPIKEIGIHEIPLRFGGKNGSCRLEVVKK